MKFLPLLFICVFAFATTGYSSDPASNYVKASAQKGDGANSLLRRYHIKPECAIREFYKINRMKYGAGLQVKRVYKLPIQIEKFNGKTIRSSIGIDDYDLAKSIQDYNDKLKKEKLRKTDFRKSKVLWVPFDLLNPCSSNSASASKTKKHSVPLGGNAAYSIFGKKHKYVKRQSSELAGNIYYIVSGHGGPDSGAQGFHDGALHCEDEYAYDVALRLSRELLSHGAYVHVIVRDNDGIRNTNHLACDKDEFHLPKRKFYINQRKRLNQRIAKINALSKKNKKLNPLKERVIVLHVDSNENHNMRIDCHFYHQKNKDSKRLTKAMMNAVREKYKQHQPNRKYDGKMRYRGLFMIEQVRLPLVFIEMGNIKNKNDIKRFTKTSNRQSLAEWFAAGILAE